MKPQEKKQAFIELRAAGKSYEAIAAELHISKGTCTAWNKELEAEVAELKREELRQLYESYHMTKEARIKKLGDALDKIDKAIEKKDLTELPADKLLDLKLRYTETLRGEYTEAPAVKVGRNMNADTILQATGELLDRVQAGSVTAEQARKETMVLTQLLRAFDTVEIKAKVDELEAVVGSRK